MFALDPAQIWESGIVGITVFFFGWALDLIPLGIIAYSAYLAAIVGDRYWVTVIGAGPLACAILVIFLTSIALSLQLLYQFNLLRKFHDIVKFGRLAAFCAAFLLLSITLKFFAPPEMVRNSVDFFEYTVLHAANDSQAEEYAQMMYDTLGNYTIHQMIWKKSIAPKIPLVCLWMAWLAVFSLHLLAINVLEAKHVTAPDETPLRSENEQRLSDN